MKVVDPTQLFPILRPESAEFLLGQYPRTVHVVAPGDAGSLKFESAPFKTDVAFDLLGISQHEVLVTAGLIDPTDMIGQNVALAALIVSVRKPGITEPSTYRVPLTTSEPATAPFYAQPSGRQLSLDYSATLLIDERAELLNGPDLREDQMLVTVGAFGTIALQTGETLVDATVWALSAGEHAVSPDLGEVIGFELSAFRTNSNRVPVKPASSFFNPDHSGALGTNVMEHQVPGAETSLSITVADEPGSGNANHAYLLTGLDFSNNPSYDEASPAGSLLVLFQNGTIPDMGVNGLTPEALLAVCAHRLQGFQNGQFACAANQTALDCVKSAIHALQERTRDRLARQVEGKHQQ